MVSLCSGEWREGKRVHRRRHDLITAKVLVPVQSTEFNYEAIVVVLGVHVKERF